MSVPGTALALIAQSANLAPENLVQTTFEFARLSRLDDERWFYLVLVGFVTMMLAFVWMMIRRDTRQHRTVICVLLFLLRTAALGGLLLFFLHLERRNVRQVAHNSRVLLMVDVSQSMGLTDRDASAVPSGPNRIDQVAAVLAEEPLLEQLRKRHDVIVFKFDREATRLVSLPKLPSNTMANLEASAPIGKQSSSPASDESDGSDDSVPWAELLFPQGEETRLGGSLRQLIDRHGSEPVSAIVLITDGGQNAGVNPTAAIQLAQEAEIPVHTVGIGTNQLPVNVRISEMVAPARAYREDAFTVTNYIQAQGLAGRTVTVELLAKGSTDENAAHMLAGSERVVLGGDGEVVPVKFEMTANEPGRRTYQVRIDAPPEDRNPRDNQQSVDVEIVGRESRVLLMASGATRDYRFLRNLLWRDRDIILDILLQSAAPGISQDADQILDEFPTTKEELYAYNVVVAFDPDWKALDPGQRELLKEWVAEEAGGLITIAGPVQTGNWLREPDMSAILALYPVRFRRHVSLLDDIQFTSTTAWPLELTRDGKEAEFLWLGETATQSQVAWSGFPGIYSCLAAKEEKPGATVYARYSDPGSGVEGKQPVYFAEHFYGSGRVFYIGSGELWRLRSLDEAYFEMLYIKLIRHVSQGRLLRGSVQGVLLVQRDRYLLGETVAVRAQLHDTHHQPLDVPEVNLQISRPDSTSSSVMLKRDPNRQGTYVGQFTVVQEGAYRLDLPIPETLDEKLSRHIQVRVPDREREHPQRNDALLSEIATRTGGKYYVGLDALLGQTEVEPLVSQLRDRTEVNMLRDSPDRQFEQQLMRWLLVVVCGALSLEWTTRRLCKLA